MSARGIEFLAGWIDKNVPGRPANLKEARKLAAKMSADAANAGLTISDLGLTESAVAKYIHEAMVHLNAPGTPGD